MDEPIEESYFRWLYSKVAYVENPTPSLTYYKLLRELHTYEFVWLLPGDDNRAQDGLDLRNEFLHLSNIDYDEYWMHYEPSILEVLIAFARRAEFDTSITVREWFWIMLANIHLYKYNDAFVWNDKKVKDILYRFVWRLYNEKGRGGLFPLKKTDHDQRKVEIYYQFCEYLVDQEYI